LVLVIYPTNKAAADLSTHKTRSVFDRYNIVNEADLNVAADRLSEHLLKRDRYNIRYDF